MDYTALRDQIKADLMADLGEYTFPDGTTAPAINLEIGEVGRTPAGTQCDRLEIIVTANPRFTMTPIVGGYQKITRGLVTLKMWDREQTLIEANSDGILDRVLDSLKMMAIDIGGITGVPQFEQLGNIEQVSIEVSAMVSHA